MYQWSIKKEENKNSISEFKVDASFRKLPKNSTCFHIWKVDEERVEAICKGNLGTFYDDCAYIIYAASPSRSYVNQETVSRDLKQSTNLERYIHFWLGEKVSSKKSGNVAYKVMELDSYFGNTATQYRESQDNESVRFMSYFRNGITVFSGQLSDSSALQDTRLFQVKGRSWLRCTEMENVNWEHFCSDYIMILKTDIYLFVWVGRSSHTSERRQSLLLAKKFQDMYAIRDVVVVDDGYEQAMLDKQKEIWNKYLPLKTRIVNQLSPISKPQSSSFKLYKCGYQSGKYRIEEMKAIVPNQIDLSDSEAAYILDGFSLGVWVWVGRSVEASEKVEAMRNARGFVKKKKYPSSINLIRVVEGHEPLEFLRLFNICRELDATKIGNVLGKFDSMTISQRPKMAAESQLVDDGTGEKRVFQFGIGLEPLELPTTNINIFCAESAYVVHYTVVYSGNNIANDLVGVKHIVYVWFGRQALPESNAKCDKFAAEYFGNLGNKSMMVKLHQGYETPHFLQVFGGKFTILLTNHSMKKLPQLCALKVTGDCSYNGKGVEVNAVTSMTSRDCFVIHANTNFVWCGQGSTGDAREVAKNIGSIFGEYTLVIEGNEPINFWDSISTKLNPDGNNNHYANGVAQSGWEIYEKPNVQLYSVYLNRGALISQEIVGFNQSSLEPENIYLLDAAGIIFLWMGRFSPVSEQSATWKIGKLFLENSTTTKNDYTAMALVCQGEEPNIFTGFFNSWNDKIWMNYITYDQMKQQLAESMNPSSVHALNQQSDFDKHQKYPLKILQSEADVLPSEVNPIRKEVHLTNDDFVSLFNMTFLEFDRLPGWKKQELKKIHKLF